MLVSFDNGASSKTGEARSNCSITFDIQNDAFGGGGGSLSRRRNAVVDSSATEVGNLRLNFTCRTLTLQNNPGTDGKRHVSIGLGNFGEKLAGELPM